jgi:hypothetical protein
VTWDHVPCDVWGRSGDAHRIAKYKESALLKTELRECDLLSMIRVFGRVDKVEGLNAGAELGRQGVDVSEHLSLALHGWCGLSGFGHVGFSTLVGVNVLSLSLCVRTLARYAEETHG